MLVRFCAVHRRPGDVDLVHARCRKKECSKVALFGVFGGSPQLCNAHRKDSMVNLNTNAFARQSRGVSPESVSYSTVSEEAVVTPLRGWQIPNTATGQDRPPAPQADAPGVDAQSRIPLTQVADMRMMSRRHSSGAGGAEEAQRALLSVEAHGAAARTLAASSACAQSVVTETSPRLHLNAIQRSAHHQMVGQAVTDGPQTQLYVQRVFKKATTPLIVQ
jgi:hypothetical protein